jgi:hypothetical protein
MDNKYDQSFRRAELGVKKENEKFDADDDSDKIVDAMHARDEYFTREPDNFGGKHY